MTEQEVSFNLLEGIKVFFWKIQQLEKENAKLKAELNVPQPKGSDDGN